MTTTLTPPLLEDDSPPGTLVRARVGRLRRRTAADAPPPRWARPALFALLGATALLYLWGLGAEGWANSFYSAAVQAGTKSWKAFFFGSFDSSNFITVDKPPAALWVMEISARIFGLNSWSILVPQALEGVATVALLYATVKRWSGHVAGLLAGAVLALTPVAALMFRFNNPDALLVLLLTAAAYATTRAVESGRTRWLVLAMTLVGTGFITKMLQAFLIVPAIALVYLVAGPTRLRRRIGQLVLSGVALVAASGWWVAIVELVPAADRPYIGGSQNNNLFNLIFGYNGLGRISGQEAGSAASQWGPTGLDRLFLPSFGGQISWLIPASLIVMVGGLWLTRRAPRTDRVRAALLFWGAWLVVSGLLLSYAKGIIHPYYTVALAPAVGALVAIGGTTLWRHRSDVIARGALALALMASVGWAFVLLGRSSDWMPWLRWMILPFGLVAAAALMVPTIGSRRLRVAVVAGALVLSLAGPAAYTIETVATAHSGAIPSAGPTVAGALGGPGGAGGGAGPGAGGLGRGAGARGAGGARPGGGVPPAGAGGGLPSGTSGSGSGAGRLGGAGGPVGGSAGRGFGAGPAGGGGAAGGGLLNASTPGSAITKLLQSNASHYTWVAAAVGANTAAGYQLASGDPVMAIGGFNGSDPTPTLAQFEKLVAQQKIHYFISGGGLGGGGTTSSTSSAIATWVEAHFSAKTVSGVTVYNLASGTTQS